MYARRGRSIPYRPTSRSWVGGARPSSFSMRQEDEPPSTAREIPPLQPFPFVPSSSSSASSSAYPHPRSDASSGSSSRQEEEDGGSASRSLVQVLVYLTRCGTSSIRRLILRVPPSLTLSELRQETLREAKLPPNCAVGFSYDGKKLTEDNSRASFHISDYPHLLALYTLPSSDPFTAGLASSSSSSSAFSDSSSSGPRRSERSPPPLHPAPPPSPPPLSAAPLPSSLSSDSFSSASSSNIKRRSQEEETTNASVLPPLLPAPSSSTCSSSYSQENYHMRPNNERKEDQQRSAHNNAFVFHEPSVSPKMPTSISSAPSSPALSLSSSASVSLSASASSLSSSSSSLPTEETTTKETLPPLTRGDVDDEEAEKDEPSTSSPSRRHSLPLSRSFGLRSSDPHIHYYRHTTEDKDKDKHKEKEKEKDATETTLEHRLHSHHRHQHHHNRQHQHHPSHSKRKKPGVSPPRSMPSSSSSSAFEQDLSLKSEQLRRDMEELLQLANRQAQHNEAEVQRLRNHLHAAKKKNHALRAQLEEQQQQLKETKSLLTEKDALLFDFDKELQTAKLRLAHFEGRELQQCSWEELDELAKVLQAGLNQLTKERLRREVLKDLEEQDKQKQIIKKEGERGGREKDGGSFCAVCLDAEQEVVFMPCSHYSCCLACSAALTKCPICQTPIQTRVRAFRT
ncbi:E3 ubiquitin-protein ligase lrsam1 [Balamuthia mandrillaris]